MKNFEGKENQDQEEIYSKVLRAGRRTYFFDVRSTRADDYYLTITESKKYTNEDGSFHYKKHKIYLYKEDFAGFQEMLAECTKFIIDEKGEEVISDYQSNGHANGSANGHDRESLSSANGSFTDIEFEDLDK